MGRFSEVIAILDESVGGPAASVGFPHGPFWREVTRDELVALEVPAFGEKLPLLVVGDSANSNLIKALKGEAPFGTDSGTSGARFRRMPAGRAALPDDKIALIEKWIDDGCPDDEAANGAPELKWRPTNAPPASSRTDDIWFVDPETGWAVNSNGQILKTEDGGASWEEQFQSGAYLRSVGFANACSGWVGTLSAATRMFHTRDGGANWLEVGNLPSEPSAICGLSVVSESVIYASGTNFPNRPPAVVKSVDGGVSWLGIDMTPHANLLVDCFFTSPDCGWVVGGKAEVPNPQRSDIKPVVLFTKDGGQSWENRVADLQNEFPLGEWGWKIQFISDSIGFVSLENFTQGAILVTRDGGASWVRKVINDPQRNANLEGVGFVDQNHGWVGGWGDATFQGGFSSETFDGGGNWIDANQIGRFINRFRFFGDPVSVGYASGKTVYKYSAQPVSLPALEAAAPAALLEAVEPARLDGPVEIVYNVPAGSDRVTVQIWDRFGEEIRWQDWSGPESGKATFVWDRRDVSGQLVAAGIYICRVTIDGKAESCVIWLE